MASFRDRIATGVRAALAPTPAPTAAPIRTDSATATGTVSTSAYSGASVLNDLSGLGGARDSGASARPNTSRLELDEDELIALLRGGIYRRIVELPAVWGTTKGWTITDDTDEENPLQADMRRLGVRLAIRRADKWARALGEARILMVVDDGKTPLSEPLDPRKVKAVRRLEVLDKREFTPVRWNDDMSKGPLGEPVLYQLHPRRPGVAYSGTVHASRLLRFYGHDLPPSELGFRRDFGADAIGQVLWDALRDLSQTGSAGARLAQELSIAVFKVGKLPAATAGDHRANMISYLRTMGLLKSVAQGVVLGPQDSFERVAATPTGFRDLSDSAKQHLAMVSEIPMALLFGDAPAGLNTDGASWQAAWHVRVADHQDERYRPPLERLVEVLYYADRGACPDEWSIEFKPLGELSEKEKAEVRLLTEQADTIAQMDGVLTVEERRAGRYGQPGGYATELQPVEALPEVEAPDADPARAAEVERMVREALGANREPGSEPKTDADDFREQRFKVPAGAKGNARKVLAWKEEHGDAVKGMTATGWRRARQLANDETVTGQDLIDMAAWFARHGADPATKKVAEEYKDEPWRDAGYVSWLGWGGDSAKTWATAAVERNREDATEGAVWIGAVLPDGCREQIAAARRAAEQVTGPLGDPGDDPHVTVLWMGQVAPEAVEEVVATARAIVERCRPGEAEAERIVTFPPSEGSDGAWPVVLDVGKAWGLYDLHHRLLRALAHLVSAKQFAEYRAHLTLGYAENLSPEQVAAVAEVEIGEVEWMIGGLQVRYGQEVVATLPLAGRTDAEAAK